jgi:periplasmic protein CpxP/Spy
MKNALLTAIALLIILPSPTSYAADVQRPGTQGQGQSMSRQQQGSMSMEKMQAKMQQMQQQMEAIRNTEDPDKRDKLIDEHMKSMQQGMDMMSGMGGGMMGDDTMMRMNSMEQRMDMMQMMMDQMVQSQGAIEDTRRMHDHRKVHK